MVFPMQRVVRFESALEVALIFGKGEGETSPGNLQFPGCV